MRTLLFLLKLADRISVPRVKEICVLNSRSFSCSNTERKSSRSFISNTFPDSAFQHKCRKRNRLECRNNSTCQSGFTQKGYRCFCAAGFEGEHCENGNYVTSNIHSCYKYHLAQISLNVKHLGLEAGKFEDPALNAVTLKNAYFIEKS